MPTTEKNSVYFLHCRARTSKLTQSGVCLYGSPNHFGFGGGIGRGPARRGSRGLASTLSLTEEPTGLRGGRGGGTGLMFAMEAPAGYTDTGPSTLRPGYCVSIRSGGRLRTGGLPYWLFALVAG